MVRYIEIIQNYNLSKDIDLDKMTQTNRQSLKSRDLQRKIVD